MLHPITGEEADVQLKMPVTYTATLGGGRSDLDLGLADFLCVHTNVCIACMCICMLQCVSVCACICVEHMCGFPLES